MACHENPYGDALVSKIFAMHIKIYEDKNGRSTKKARVGRRYAVPQRRRLRYFRKYASGSQPERLHGSV